MKVGKRQKVNSDALISVLRGPPALTRHDIRILDEARMFPQRQKGPTVYEREVLAKAGEIEFRVSAKAREARMKQELWDYVSASSHSPRDKLMVLQHLLENAPKNFKPVIESAIEAVKKQ